MKGKKYLFRSSLLLPLVFQWICQRLEGVETFSTFCVRGQVIFLKIMQNFTRRLLIWKRRKKIFLSQIYFCLLYFNEAYKSLKILKHFFNFCCKKWVWPEVDIFIQKCTLYNWPRPQFWPIFYTHRYYIFLMKQLKPKHSRTLCSKHFLP